MIKGRALVTLVAITAIGALALAACGGDDDDSGGGSTATATAASEISKTPAGTTAAAGATTAAATATTSGAQGGIVTSHEACDLMTAADVAEALGDSATGFENASLGMQATNDPFTDANQCQFTDFNTGHTAWLIASFAPSSAASEVKQKLDADCQGEDMVSGLGDGACYPQFTGQLRVVKGSVYLDFFASAEFGDDMTAALRTLAEKALARLP